MKTRFHEDITMDVWRDVYVIACIFEHEKIKTWINTFYEGDMAPLLIVNEYYKKDGLYNKKRLRKDYDKYFRHLKKFLKKIKK